MDSDVIRRERAQVGIGTLIVFVAMVLVAAIAAGVLLHTGGTLQSSAEQTGQESTEQVSNRVVVVSALGHVTGEVKNVGQKSNADVMPNGSVDTVELTVKLSPGSGPVNLSEATISWLGPESATALAHGEAADHAPGVEDESDPGTFGLGSDPGGGGRSGGGGGTDPSQAHEAFNTYAVDGDDHALLADRGDRIRIRVNAGLVEAETRDAVTPPYSEPLAPGSEVTLRLTTASGSTTLYRLAVPAALSGERFVSL